MDEPVFVDTNVFLRFFVRDVEHLYLKAMGLFEGAEKGEIRLETTDLVIAEIVWVLESYYGFTRKEIKEVVEAVIGTRNLRVSNSALINSAIGLYGDGNMDFIDAYNIAYIRAKGHGKVATFDMKHFKKAEGLELFWK